MQSCFPRGILQVERGAADERLPPLLADYSVKLGRSGRSNLFIKELPTLVAVIKRNYESNDGTKYQDEAEQLRVSNIHAHHLPSGRGKQPSAVGGSAPAQKRQKYCNIQAEKMQL